MSRLSIELTAEQHQMIKAIAAMQGTSIREYVLQRVLPSCDEEQVALRELEAFLAPRLASAKNGNLVSISATQVFEETLASKPDA